MRNNNIATTMNTYKNFINAVIIATYNDCTIGIHDRAWRSKELIRREIEFRYHANTKKPIFIAFNFTDKSYTGQIKRRFYTTQDVILYLISRIADGVKMINCIGDENYFCYTIDDFTKYVNRKIETGAFIIPVDYIVKQSSL